MKKIKEPEKCYWESWQHRHNLIVDLDWSDEKVLEYLTKALKNYRKSGGDADTFFSALAELQAWITLFARRFGAEGKQKGDKPLTIF